MTIRRDLDTIKGCGTATAATSADSEIFTN